jgi:Binding-protein-dependent transport system inner membrane component
LEFAEFSFPQIRRRKIRHAIETAFMASPPASPRSKSDVPFYVALYVLGGSYVLLIVALVAAEFLYARPGDFARIFADHNIRNAIRLSVISSTVSTILALWVSVPIAYLMSRSDFRGKQIVDAIVDIPIVLPPLVVGLCLLILFRQTPLQLLDDRWPIAFHVPAVIMAQFTVVTAFAVRTLRASFDEISPRQEQVALTLGCRVGLCRSHAATNRGLARQRVSGVERGQHRRGRGRLAGDDRRVSRRARHRTSGHPGPRPRWSRRQPDVVRQLPRRNKKTHGGLNPACGSIKKRWSDHRLLLASSESLKRLGGRSACGRSELPGVARTTDV